MLVESLVPMRGATLLAGREKSGKTLLMAQLAISVASGKPLMGYYRVLEPGPAMVFEQDDPGGVASIQEIMQKSPDYHAGLPFYFVPKVKNPPCGAELAD